MRFCSVKRRQTLNLQQALKLSGGDELCCSPSLSGLESDDDDEIKRHRGSEGTRERKRTEPEQVQTATPNIQDLQLRRTHKPVVCTLQNTFSPAPVVLYICRSFTCHYKGTSHFRPVWIVCIKCLVVNQRIYTLYIIFISFSNLEPVIYFYNFYIFTSFKRVHCSSYRNLQAAYCCSFIQPPRKEKKLTLLMLTSSRGQSGWRLQEGGVMKRETMKQSQGKYQTQSKGPACEGLDSGRYVLLREHNDYWLTSLYGERLTSVD